MILGAVAFLLFIIPDFGVVEVGLMKASMMAGIKGVHVSREGQTPIDSWRSGGACVRAKPAPNIVSSDISEMRR